MDEVGKNLVWLCACSGLELRERDYLYRMANEDAELLLRNLEKFCSAMIKKGASGVYNIKPLSVRQEETARFLAKLEESDIFTITVLDEDYPTRLKHVPFPPLVLFGTGKRELLKKKLFTIVGSRSTPPYAEKQCLKIASALKTRFAIVTGLAEGGDAAAIKGALPEVISVLPCGLSECYPASHHSLKKEIAEKGLLLSEYPPNEKVKKYSFHARNRILAGMSEGTLVVSAGEKSGALITADYAVEYGADVFAFPYSVGIAQGAGCNSLIKKGAYLCTDETDIFYHYGMTAPEKQTIALSAEEQSLMNVLKEEGILHAAVIADKTGLKVYEVTATLSALEIKGLVVKAGGNRYSIV